MRRTSMLSLLALLLAACGGGEVPTTCRGGGARSLEIVDPGDGDEIATARYDVLVQTCGIESGEELVLRSRQPVESDYAFATVTIEGEIVRFDVPLLPGTMELRVLTRDGTVQSPSVTFQSTPP